MKKVSIRDFQLNAAKYMKEIPFVITRYNVPVAKVVSLVKKVTTDEDYNPTTCDYCNKTHIGAYKVEKYDWEKGEIKEDHYLCEEHHQKASKEGTVTRILT